jgi:signal transduction histidine kinase
VVSTWAANPFGERHWRAVAVARPGMLALVVALSGVRNDPDTTWWWLVALGFVALAAGVAERFLTRAWPQYAAEIAAASLIIGIGMPHSGAALPYLLLPAFAAGMAGSVIGVAWITNAGTIGLLIGLLLRSDETLSAESLVGLLPWVAMIFATGAVGAWFRRQQMLQSADATRYGAAYRLLAELRVIARQLSGGLDPVTLATGVLSEVSARVPTRRSALLVRREGGILLPLATQGTDENWLARPEQDPIVIDAWTHETPTIASLGRRGHRIVLPLQVGARTIGAVVADIDDAILVDELNLLARSTDEGALRLETALLFDEVREIATREERRRLAREIHDGIAQELASLGYLIDDLQARAKGADLRSLAITLRKEVTRILSDLRHSIFDLRSDVPADAGFGTALADYARRVGSQTGVTVHLIHDESHERMRPEVEAELLRIGQEAINNVRKHAKAHNLWVTVRVAPPAARIQVADDGVGLGLRARDRYGLDIMAERARRVGATLEIDKRPDGGTVVDVSIGADDRKG